MNRADRRAQAKAKVKIEVGDYWVTNSGLLVKIVERTIYGFRVVTLEDSWVVNFTGTAYQSSFGSATDNSYLSYSLKHKLPSYKLFEMVLAPVGNTF